MSKSASSSQKKIARNLKIKLTGQSTRVLAAQIVDAQENQALTIAKKLKLAPGVRVTYVGKETALKHKSLTITKVSERGFVFFKATKLFARPHNLKII